ncbi:MAG TPA: hypothetical protein VLI90_10185 [Tepidisphaeraceae bacterium]|nr:hypothetical protein [Tepidisphaeraceae bacterium]
MQQVKPDQPSGDPPSPLPYRSAAADRADHPRSRGSSFAIGCLATILCIVLLASATVANATRNWAPYGWTAAGPALLAIGVAIGARRRDWGFFYGVLAWLILLLSLVGLLFALCR